MKFAHSATYAATPDQVFAMLTDAKFREQVATSQKSPAFDVDVTSDGGITTVTMQQSQAVRKVPDFAKKLVGDQVEIKQVETWRSPDGGSIEITIPGKPGALRGSVTLVAQGDTTVHEVTGELKVSIPLIGGKLEGVVADLIKLAMDEEAEVGATWLAGQA